MESKSENIRGSRIARGAVCAQGGIPLVGGGETVAFAFAFVAYSAVYGSLVEGFEIDGAGADADADADADVGTRGDGQRRERRTTEYL